MAKKKIDELPKPPKREEVKEKIDEHIAKGLSKLPPGLRDKLPKPK